MLRKTIYLPFLLLLTVALAGCPSNPIRTAETLEQKGDALYGQYVILKEQGAALLQDASVPDSVKRPVAVAMTESKPIANELQDALIQYSKIKAQLAAGQTTEDQLLIASQKLNEWITEIGPLIRKLKTAVDGA